MVRVRVLNGPNLNLLGIREPKIYGSLTLEQIDERVSNHAENLGMEVQSSQHNSEGEIIDAIHASMGWADAIIINPYAKIIAVQDNPSLRCFGSRVRRTALPEMPFPRGV